MSAAMGRAMELAARNLTQMQRIDNAASRILDKVPYAAVYKMDPVTQTWYKTGCEGTLFIYERACSPCFSFLVASTKVPSDFIELLTVNHKLRHDGNFIFFFNGQQIHGLWCHRIEDSKRVFDLLQELVDELKGSSTEQANRRLSLDSP